MASDGECSRGKIALWTRAQHISTLSEYTPAPSPWPRSVCEPCQGSAAEPDSAVNLPHPSHQTRTLCHRPPRGGDGGLASLPPLTSTDRWMDWISPVSHHLLQISHHEGFATASVSVKVTFSHGSAPLTLVPLFLEEREGLHQDPSAECRSKHAIFGDGHGLTYFLYLNSSWEKIHMREKRSRPWRS